MEHLPPSSSLSQDCDYTCIIIVLYVFMMSGALSRHSEWSSSLTIHSQSLIFIKQSTSSIAQNPNYFPIFPVKLSSTQAQLLCVTRNRNSFPQQITEKTSTVYHEYIHFISFTLTIRKVKGTLIP